MDIRPRRPLGIGVERHAALAGVPPRLPVVPRLEDRPDPVIIDLGNRVIAMVMTPGTANSQTQQRRGNNPDRVGHHFITGDHRIDPAGTGTIGSHPQEPRRRQKFDLAWLEGRGPDSTP